VDTVKDIAINQLVTVKEGVGVFAMDKFPPKR
jgi:hypothetical protein